MTRRHAVLLWALVLCLVGTFYAPASVCAQGEGQVTVSDDVRHGGGDYISWIKLVIVIVIYFVWMNLADRLNRDAIRFGDRTGMTHTVWNPIVIFSFLGGLVAVFAIPLFLAGFPLFLAGAFLPMVFYRVGRRGKISEGAREGSIFDDKITQNVGSLTIKAAGKNKDESQSNLIRARQSDMFEPTVEFIADCWSKRTEQILLDYSREAVNGRLQIDGIWHPLPTRDRPSGDAMLVVLKSLANLNPADRRQMQRGRFRVKRSRDELSLDVHTQGVPSGERALIRFLYEDTMSSALDSLGMQPGQRDALVASINGPQLVIVSSPFGQGLSTTWQSILNGSDRFTRDWVAVVDHDENETERENIDIIRFDSRATQSPAGKLKSLILKQPAVYVVPNPVDSDTLDLLTDQVVTENRTVITQTRAASAAEAILRVMSLSKNRADFIKSLGIVTCQRLVRQLCQTCRQPVQVNPKLIAQLGGNPATGTTLYRHFELPPPEKRVDAEGKPVEMSPCPDCAGIGFVGRIAVFEQVVVNEAIRAALTKAPQLDPVAKVIRQQGNLTMLEQMYRAVLEGRTALNEVQRVMQAPQTAPARSSN